MSSIKLSPNASGTGEFTISAPNSNTNRTLTLPDQTGTVLTNAGPFTANASASAGAVTIDASNNVGIGTGSPARQLHVSNSNNAFERLETSATGAVAAIEFKNSNSQTHSIGIETSAGNAGFNGSSAYALCLEAAGARDICFATNGAGRARIDSSGNLLVGTTSQVQGAERVAIVNSTVPLSVNRTGSDGVAISMHRSGTTVGSISVTASATAYNTSSDYRLKEQVQPMTGALATVSALKPVTYKWKSDGSDGQGFIAHELQAVAPDCVTGEKDAVDAEGNPVYQGIDTSFLVATLTAALQELNAKVAALEARLASDGPSNEGQA